MLDYFRSLVRKECPTLILDVQTVSYDQLSVVTCRYEKDGAFFVALAYYTDSWIGKTPLGPLHKQIYGRGGRVKLRDIANVRKQEDHYACMHFPTVTADDIKKTTDVICRALEKNIEPVMLDNPDGDSFQYKLLVAPYPSLIVSVKSPKEFVGTIMILCDGTVLPCFICNVRLNSYVDLLNSRRSVWLNKIQLLGGGCCNECK